MREVDFLGAMKDFSDLGMMWERGREEELSLRCQRLAEVMSYRDTARCHSMPLHGVRWKREDERFDCGVRLVDWAVIFWRRLSGGAD